MTLSSLKLSLILIPLAIGASYLHAQTTPPPGDNLAPPVHTLSGSQVKTSGLSVTGFLANQQATFKQNTFISGLIKGSLTGNSSTVSLGSTTQSVFAQATGTIENKLALGSDRLKNTASRTVCGTTGGEVVLCDGSIGGGGTPSSPFSATFDNTNIQNNPLLMKINTSQLVTKPGGLAVRIRVDTAPVIGGTGIPQSSADYTITIPNGASTGSIQLQAGAYIVLWKCIYPSPDYQIVGLLEACG